MEEDTKWFLAYTAVMTIVTTIAIFYIISTGNAIRAAPVIAMYALLLVFYKITSGDQND